LNRETSSGRAGIAPDKLPVTSYAGLLPNKPPEIGYGDGLPNIPPESCDDG
jgi:hypothetical protein